MMSRLNLLVSLACVMAIPATALAQDTHGVAVTVHVDAGARHHHRVVPAWVPPTGPQIYYGTHYNHIPAYPEPNLYGAYPVPIFPNARRLPVLHYGVSAHVQWCHARYRSYRVSDNSYQPYHGARRPCWSPYG
jgi:hypothetical protein